MSERPATIWEEALITGNGSIGALVMSRPLEEVITFSHERLFMPWDPSGPVVHMAPHLEEIRGLITDGRYREAAEFAQELGRREGYRGMRWTDPLVPAFDLKIDMAKAGEPSEYLRSVDFATGVATTRWEDERGVFVRRVFVSRPDGIAVVSVRGDGAGQVDCRVRLAVTGRPGSEGDFDAEEESAAVFRRGVKNVATEADGDTVTYRSVFALRRSGSIAGCEGVVRVVARDGSIDATDESIGVSGADEVLLLVSVAVVGDANDERASAARRRLAEINADFDELLARHADAHGAIFLRSRLDLNGGADRALSTEQLLEKSRLGDLNRALLEKQFDAARYAILCSSGELPPTLQGVWSGGWAPPWQSDYTHNGNVPSALACMLPANMPECMEAYIGYMESLTPHFRENARRLYGCRGIMVPSRTSAHGYNVHFSEEYPHLFWTPGAAWAARHFYDYYLYTGDRGFLEARAVPFMREAALFFEDFLQEGPDGKYVFNPSYSPENTPQNSDSQACINATMDIALVDELLTNLIAASEELGGEPDNIARWKAMRRKLPAYRVNDAGAIAEWASPELLDNNGHRHASHLCALFNGLPAGVAGNPELRDAFVAAVEDRMTVRQESRGGVMSFGLVQLGQSAASLGERELAYEALDMLANVYWRPNLVSTHNPQSLFNVDICGGMPAVILRMLVRSRPGMITLLPAAPEEWPSGRVEGILCRGQIEIESLEWQRGVVSATLSSTRGQTVVVKTHGTVDSATLQGEAGGLRRGPGSGGGFVVTLPAGESVTLRLEPGA